MIEEQQLRQFCKKKENFNIQSGIHFKDIHSLIETKGNTNIILNEERIKKEIEETDISDISNEVTDEIFIEPEIKFEEESLSVGYKEERDDEKEDEEEVKVEVQNENLENNEATQLLKSSNNESPSYTRKSLSSLIKNTAWCDFSKKDYNDEAVMLICTKCNLNFTSETTFFNHQKNCCADLFKCPECHKTFDRPISLKIHMAFHGSLKKYKCKMCKKSFTRKSGLKDHALSHSGEKPYQCDVCKKFYRSKRSLVSHFRYHFKDKIYECPVCKKSFFQPSGLSEHIRMHKKAKEYKCNICAKCFGYGSSLKRHIKSHFGIPVYKCNECDKCFRQNSSLSFHKRTKHLGIKPYKCEDCDKTFCRAWSLRNHMNIHRIFQIPKTVEIISAKKKIDANIVR